MSAHLLEAALAASVRGSVAAITVTAVAAHVVFRLFGRLAVRRAAPGSALRRTMTIGLPATAVVAYVAVLVADLPTLVRLLVGASVPAVAGTPVGSAVVQFGTGLGVVVVVLAGHLGTLPAFREVQDADYRTLHIARRMGRYLLVMLAVLVAVLQLWAAVRAATSLGGTIVVVSAVGLVVALVGAPWLNRLAAPTRRPTRAERDRVDDLLATADLAVRGVLVLDDARRRTNRIYVRGVPGLRYLFVTEHLLGEADDDRAATLVSLAAGEVRYGYATYRIVVHLVAVVGLGVELVSGPVGAVAARAGLPVLLGPLVVVLSIAGLLYVGQRLVYRIDGYAADRVGAETVARTLEDAAETHGIALESGRLPSLLVMRPPLGRRIDRLYERAAATG